MTFDICELIPRGASDDRAVSPVVGVALLIAITVILAAVIGFVVLDTTVTDTNTPNARLDFEGVSPTTVTHEGGDSIPAEEVVVRVSDTNGTTVYFARLDDDSEFNVGPNLNTGTRFQVPTDSGDTVFVFWEDPDSSREVQLGKATVE